MRIKDSTILVSGGSSGLGAACAHRFLSLGANVMLLDLSPPNPDWIAQGGDRCHYAQGDVTKDEEVRSAIEQCHRELGPLSAAITCAGILHAERSFGHAGVASLEAFRRVVDVNLVGTFNVVRLCAEAQSHKVLDTPGGERGVIVMTSSIAAFDGQRGQAAYAGSKGGVASMTLPLARDLGSLGIRVVSIAPGVFETPMMKASPENVRQSLQKETLFPSRFGEPEEFAAAVQHVLENQMFNGCTLRLDAGLRMPAK